MNKSSFCNPSVRHHCCALDQRIAPRSSANLRWRSVTEVRPFLHATSGSGSGWPAAGSTGTWRGSGGSHPWNRGSASTAAPTEDAKWKKAAVRRRNSKPLLHKLTPDLELLLSSYWVPLVALEGDVGLFNGHSVHRFHDLGGEG